MVEKPDDGAICAGFYAPALLPSRRTARWQRPRASILRDTAEVGTAWKKRSDKVQCISLVLDDPLLPAPLYANSYTREDGITVVLWNRADR